MPAYYALAEDYRSAYEAAKARVEAKRILQAGNKREREDPASQEETSEDSDGGAEKKQEIIDDQDWRRSGRRHRNSKDMCK